MSKRAEIDAWMARHAELKRGYIERDGMTEEAADEKAVAEVRREIRQKEAGSWPR